MHKGVQQYFFRFTVWFTVCAFFLPVPVITASASENPHNVHVLRRLNSPERQAGIAEAARQDAAAREELVRGERQAMSDGAALAERGNSGASTPQSLTEVLFNHAAGFMGVPGLMPRRGVDGSLDEGLGFHQDGTARKAGGVTGASGPSAYGQRAGAYMRAGLPNGYGPNGHAPGLYDEMSSDFWGRNDPTRGGRVSGNAYSRELGDFDPLSMAIDRGLSYGAGFLNGMGEAGISSLIDGGRARLNFYLDRDGHFSGEGDALLPLYDSARTTVYTQLGARSMHDSSDTRWIGNFGVGQRWFPLATGDGLDSAEYDTGNLMLGYNAFFDYDFTRDHQRGGIGAEVWYDWLRLASNYYFPLSGWKGSEDFDSSFVKERAAKGWDTRVKAYLPFYRNLALAGAYSQWYGDHVGMFGADSLEKNPKVWSYGVEYTPIPLVSGFITQRSTERGRTDTEFGLTFTYHFRMPWEDQISHAKVTELRTVGGSRHEFVDRENRIILEYKAKDAYRIEYLGFINGLHQFRLRDGFNKAASGQTATVTSLSGAVLLGGLSTLSASTDGNGVFGLGLESTAPDPTRVTIQAGGNSQTFTLAVGAVKRSYAFDFTGSSTTLPSYADGINPASLMQTATIMVRVTDLAKGGAAVANKAVTWEIVSVADNESAVYSARRGVGYGLAWGDAAPAADSYNIPIDKNNAGAWNLNTDDNGNASVQLTDVIGNRTVTVKITVDGESASYSVTFGAGPLSKFDLSKTGGTVGTGTSDGTYSGWYKAYYTCGGTGYTGDPATWTVGQNVAGGVLPSREDLGAVSGSGGAGNDVYGNQAALHAGWSLKWYWMDEANESYFARVMGLLEGAVSGGIVSGETDYFVCPR